MHPDVAARNCADCRRFLYMDRGEGQFGELLMRGGKPVLRVPKAQPTPCKWCPKVPPGEPPVPESAVELSDKNARAVQHYRECAAVGEFPNDAIVRRNAAVIAAADLAAERRHQARTGLAVLNSMKGV